ncbi:type 1 fimbrial protein (plasmid) [Serratia ureilytica]|uniref:fimbrial protein n=1 Tax=Serratia ureilytica TaxID=300181 RepID=UPI001CC0FC3B|nr:type 1 fimbrial protein [Serratia ureilytica]UAN29732.1 type 1 fimbrial protein [Serratia ureilytica]
MKKYTYIALLLAITYTVNAADVTINFTGMVVASPCTITATSQTVNLGDNIQARDLATPGNFSAFVPFTLNLTNCPLSTSTVVATFNGTPPSSGAIYPGASQLYANTGTATNVAVQLTDTSGVNVLGNGASLAPITVVAGNVTIPLQANIMAIDSGVMPGSITSTVGVTFIYN